MNLDNPFDQRQTDASSLRSGIKLFKQIEDPRMVFGIDANAVIADEQSPFTVAIFNTHLDSWSRLFAHVLGSVVDQILEDLQNAGPVTVDDR